MIRTLLLAAALQCFVWPAPAQPAAAPAPPAGPAPQMLQPLTAAELPMPIGGARSVALGKDGKKAFVVMHWDVSTVLRVIDTTTGKTDQILHEKEYNQFVPGLPRVLSLPGGDVLFQPDDGSKVFLLDGATGQIKAEELDLHRSLSRTFAISCDGRFAYAGAPRAMETWDLATLKIVRTVRLEGVPDSLRPVPVAANRAGRVVVMLLSDKTEDTCRCVLINPEDGRIEKSVEVECGVVAISSPAERMVIASVKQDQWDMISAWSTANLERVSKCKAPVGTASAWVSLDRSGTTLAIQEFTLGVVALVDVATGRLTHVIGPAGTLGIVGACAADQARLVVVGGPGVNGSVRQSALNVYPVGPAPTPGTDAGGKK